MGQALRRAIGKGRPPSLDPSRKTERPRVVVASKPELPKREEVRFGAAADAESLSKNRSESSVLEERDPEYDAMLRQMVGRISSKPGGKPEMGEASVVQRYNRPMPKLRDTKPGAGYDEQKAVPPGTLNIAKLRQVFLFHEGKADGQSRPMDAKAIAETLKIDVVHVQRVLQHLSLPPEGSSEGSTDESR
ncbi:uncharacterized protein LOC116261754 [Nymphaea colorata]|nr:uncharacterized protein LOC116261754 [Nymphaea colorata]